MDVKAISYGKHLTLQKIVATIADQGDRIVIASFISFTELAIYNIARIFESIPIFTPFTNPAFIKMAQMEREKAFKAIMKRMGYIMLFYFILLGTSIVVVPYFITLLFTSAYSSSILYAQLIIFSVFIGVPGTYFMQLFKAQRETTIIYKITVLHRSVEIILFLVLIIPFGILGMIAAKIVSKGLYSILGWSQTSKELSKNSQS